MSHADLIIVGSGIAGLSVAHAAVARGLAPLVVEQYLTPARHEDVGSYAAIGVIRLGWLGSVKQRERARYALGLYRKLGLLGYAGARVTSWQYPTATPKTDPDYYAVDVTHLRKLYPYYPRLGRATAVVQGDGLTPEPGVVLADGAVMRARLGIVVCAGAGTPSLGGPAQSLSYGATLVAPAPKDASASLAVHRVRPYVCLVQTVSADEVRTGSSTHASLDEVDAGLAKLVAASPWQGPMPGTIMRGVRAYAEGYKLTEDYEPYWAAPNVCYMAGFGKLGYSLAPAVAAEVVERLVALCPPQPEQD